MSSDFSWPLDHYRTVSSGFTDPRWYGLHSAIDLPAHKGVPVHPVAAGTVIFSGYAGDCGSTVWIAHVGGWRSHYCHLSQILAVADQTVTPTNVIGLVGDTGRAGYPHLHLNLFAPNQPPGVLSKYIPWVGKWAVDPLVYLPGAGQPRYYTVVSGDTASQIAQDHGLTIYRWDNRWQGTFVDLNPGQPRSGDWNLIYPGERFRVA